MAKISREAAFKNETLTFPVKQSSKSRIGGKLLYWWCWLVAGSLLLFVGAPALIILWLIDRRTSLYPLARWGARTWLKACGAQVKILGSENVDPNVSYVFASNHRSYLDTAALFAYAGPKIGLVAKKELLKVPVMGQGMGFVNVIAIDRSNPERAVASMEKAREVVNKGYSFGVFVEGTRALPGKLLPFKKGAFHLALQTGAPIIPVAIRNTDWMMGKGRGLAYPGEVEMILLPPIPTAGKTSDDIPDLLLQTRQAIADELSIK
jgi:1-acyl-sn-glycerol-3-phosphate acyltransferase